MGPNLYMYYIYYIMGGLGAYVGTVGPMMRTLWFGRGFVYVDGPRLHEYHPPKLWGADQAGEGSGVT